MDIQETALQQKEIIKKFKALVEEVNICMFTTIDENHNVVSRPMSTSYIDDEANVWFFTNEFSEKVQEVSKDNVVDLIYSHPVKNIYLSVKGTCSLLIDKKKMEELWHPSMKAWLPQGLDDPKICLLKVATETAFFWNQSNSKVGLLFQMLGSLTRGSSYKEDEKGKLDLNFTPPEK